MDNGSTDKTSEVVKLYPEIKYTRLTKNLGLNAYKKLFNAAEGEYIVIVDDDVLDFPVDLDQIFIEYMSTFSDFGFLALDVIQNEFTDGAKPALANYTEVCHKDLVVQQGPTGGWCTVFRRKDYRKVKFLFQMKNLNFKKGEDGTLSRLFRKWLKLKNGIIKNKYCFHACGPYYAKKYGHLEREIEKYRASGLEDYVEKYEALLPDKE